MSTNFLVSFRHLNCNTITRFIDYCYPTILLQTLIIFHVCFYLGLFSGTPQIYPKSDTCICIPSSITQCYIPLKKRPTIKYFRMQSGLNTRVLKNILFKKYILQVKSSQYIKKQLLDVHRRTIFIPLQEVISYFIVVTIPYLDSVQFSLQIFKEFMQLNKQV